MKIDPATTTIRREDFRTIIHQLTEDHTVRQYWDKAHRQSLSHQMLQAIDGIPSAEDATINIDEQQWSALAVDLAHASTISPPQWAAEIARCVIV